MKAYCPKCGKEAQDLLHTDQFTCSGCDLVSDAEDVKMIWDDEPINEICLDGNNNQQTTAQKGKGAVK